MDVLITGASGFLGKRIYGYLKGSDHRIYSLIMPGESKKGLGNAIIGDITEPHELRLPSCDIIIHCAGILESSHPGDEKLMKVNYEGTRNVFNAGLKCGMKRFIFISTISALGPQGSKDDPMTENMKPAPKDVYGISKLKAEQYLYRESKKRDITVTVLRPSVLYGPGMNLNSSGMKTFTAIRKGVMPFVDDGSYTLNMLFVDNLVHCVLSVLTRSGDFRIFHVAEEPYEQKYVIATIEKRMGKKGHRRIPGPVLWFLTLLSEMTSPFIKGPPPLSWTKYHGLTSNIWTMSNERLKKELNFDPPYTLEEGINITCDIYGW